MGKSKLKFVKTEQTKLTVTGYLGDVETIAYQDENNEDQLIRIADLVAPFVGKDVTLILTEKTDDDIAV